MLFINLLLLHLRMAKSLTGSFYLTEAITLASTMTDGQRVQGEIDLGAYVSVPTGLAVAIESVDFVYQNDPGMGSAVQDMVSAAGALSVQLTDLNPGTTFVRADNQSLVASGSLQIDKTNNIASYHSDLYPDNFGPASSSEAFMVVNDSLYLVGGVDAADIGANDVYITARIRCRIVKLSQRDWVAIAVQSTASDN